MPSSILEDKETGAKVSPSTDSSSEKIWWNEIVGASGFEPRQGKKAAKKKNVVYIERNSAFSPIW